MPQQRYKRPPITEAVIEIRFTAAIDGKEVEKISLDLVAAYPHSEQIQTFGLEMQFGPQRPEAQVRPARIGVKRTTLDADQTVLLWPESFVFSQLAPYPGWDEFFSRFVRDWRVCKKIAGYKKIARVGVRFINRIDVPVHSFEACITDQAREFFQR
jgi:uncharacterized protein (TIGR04255 family)